MSTQELTSNGHTISDEHGVAIPGASGADDLLDASDEKSHVDDKRENGLDSAAPECPQPQLHKSGKTQKTFNWSVLWIALLTTPLAVVSSATIFAYSLSYVYDEYITKIFAAADWRHTGRLSDELTYYDRWCDVSDITSFSMDDFIVSPDEGAEQSVDRMMLHGLSIFPDILTKNTTANLREFIMRRNKEVTPAEAIPLDGEDNRWSYGIGGNEDPSVVAALREVATNRNLRPALEGLLGPDPAVVEITAITSAYGAEHQGMHSDVKALGNSVKYGRTFTHSYSLFIGLQDTTEEMGATQICPGTHYCANDLADECVEHGFTVARDGPWKEGDAMLLNQCLWHRGTEHTDPEAQHRAVFIVTFISRPRFGIDNRQLAHGTYFHIRWDMWGHTLNDLLDAAKYMPNPLTVLRSGGIWKPSSRKWGWDWLTVASLRIANEESGYSFEDLDEWVHSRDALGLPHFLRGPVFDENGGWDAFISGTIQNITAWARKLNAAALGAYVVVIILSALVSRCFGGGSKFMLSSTKFLIYSHGIIASIGCFLIYELNTSEWAENIKSGKLLARPFPDHSSVHPALNGGPTTVPEKNDVLIGCRFDSRDLAAYDNFLDYHPGNRAWLKGISSLADAYPSFVQLPPAFRDALVNRAVEETLKNENRFLLQNKLGDWSVLPKRSSREYTLREVVKTSNPLVRALDREIAYMLADSRFGLMLRNTKLGQKHSQSSLEQWRETIFRAAYNTATETSDTSEFVRPGSKLDSAGGFTTRSLAALPRLGKIESPSASSHTQDADIFQIGDRVEIGWNTGGSFLLGTVLGFEEDEVYVQYLEDGEREDVPDYRVRRYTGPLQEGDRVEAEYDGDGWFSATVMYAYADRRFDILFDDGDKSLGLEADYVRRGVLEHDDD